MCGASIMGFLKRLIKNAFRDETVTRGRSSFETVSEQQLEDHLQIARYGSYLLTDAIRPSVDLQVVPSAGWRRDSFKDDGTGITIPVLMASQTKERLFDLFIDLLEPLGETVDVVLESSHDTRRRDHVDTYREQIDLPILKSLLYDFEDLLTNDGCTGIAVLNPRIPMEVQFDEHKLLVMYGHDLEAFEEVLETHRVHSSDTLRFITEGEHVHSSSEEYADQFNELKYQIGVEDE
jgi:hypothetical protein